jgi:hypothetical protein
VWGGAVAKKIKYETYFQERTSLVNAELDQARSFDKYILTLAGGTFGLSIVFIEKIAPHPEAGTVWLLVTAWVTFGASILSTLISFLLSQLACSRQREILDLWYRKDGKLSEDEQKNPFAACTKWLNWTSMILFIGGVAFLAAFSALNLAT